MTTAARPTVQSLADDVVTEWRAGDYDGDPTSFVEELAASTVPVMTTELFQMVVDDNRLAFLESPNEGDEPFMVLAEAVRSEVTRLALERIARINEEQR